MVKTKLLLVASVWLVATPTFAQLQCPDAEISVVAEADDAPSICEMASSAIAELATCSVPLDRPILIEVVETLPGGCIGQYHCGEDRIELLSPGTAQAGLESDDPLASVDPDAFYYSILVHELTHAALDRMPCPFSRCYATQEYVAYAMQMRSFPPEARAKLLTRPEFDRPISAEEINEPIALFAPDVFMQKAWLHFSQQEEPCESIGQIMAGKILFDRDIR